MLGAGHGSQIVGVGEGHISHVLGTGSVGSQGTGFTTGGSQDTKKISNKILNKNFIFTLWLNVKNTYYT